MIGGAAGEEKGVGGEIWATRQLRMIRGKSGCMGLLCEFCVFIFSVPVADMPGRARAAALGAAGSAKRATEARLVART
ncbi:hypothetical protein ASE00_07805 [Sphingomonas sp. Root710]|nr:hypothetical protein ASE00_07805 [Sphingomonas sp. Root710]